MHLRNVIWITRTAIFLSLAACLAAARPDRYAVVLADEPIASSTVHTQRLLTAQMSLKAALKQKKLTVLDSVQTVANAVFVSATAEQAEELRKLPGVTRVVRMRAYKRQLNRAVDLVNASAGWNAAGGAQNAGAGMKIAVLDTGIDQTHPAFQDASLTMPNGFPKCGGGDCAYTTNKVVAARSYVLTLATWPSAVAAGAAPEEVSRPDDLTPRDRVGHGTALAAIAAAVSHNAPLARISGVAPKAYLGNYKIFGSPGVNDITFEDVLIKALDDAYKDGMDVAVVAVGDPQAEWGPTDSGSVCGNSAGVACGLFAAAVESASKKMAVVVAAGNYGGDGLKQPSLNTLATPGTAPSAITVGASTNSHILYASVRMGASAPSNLQQIDAMFGDGARPLGPTTAPVRDVAKLGNDGMACSALGSGALAGAIALIQTGNCSYMEKVNNAQSAGAVGVILYRGDGSNFVFVATGLTGTGIPMALIGGDDGIALKNFLASNQGAPGTLDPSLQEQDASYDTVAYFSSQGPSIGNDGIKPELVAVGTDLYVPTQKFDPNSDMYAPSGYLAVEGTSFAAAMVAGAVAMVKQKNPSLLPDQLKSLVVNTASHVVDDVDGLAVASVAAAGAGKLNVGDALKSTVTVVPATLSFGDVGIAAANPQMTLLVFNTSSQRVSLTLSIERTTPENNSHVALSASTLDLAGGQGRNVTVRLDGTAPLAGTYEGAINIQGGPVPLRVPFLYTAGGAPADNLIPVRNYDFVANPNQKKLGLEFKVVDQFGIPVPNVPVTFTPALGSALDSNAPCPQKQGVYYATPATDDYGIAYAEVCMGPQLGEQSFTGAAAGMSLVFIGRSIPQPAISAGGVVNAATFRVDNGLSPGSYISIFGSGFSEGSRAVVTPYLPVSLVGVSVSFDVPERGLSVPGHLHFVRPDQINVQIPWEFQGLDSVKMKVSYGDFQTAIYQVPLAKYSPGVFAVVDENYAPLSSAKPAVRGRTILVFCNGLGPVDNQPASGELSPAQPYATTKVRPEVTIGGRPAQVDFSGMTPNLVGLYQLNVVVPQGAPSGDQPLVIGMEGTSYKTVNVPIQ